MKITIAKRDLDTALRVVSHTVSSEGDITGHYLFRPVGPSGRNSIEVLSLNGRVFSSCPTTARFEEEGGKPFTIEAKRLNTLLEAIKDDATLTIASNGAGEVSVNSGRGKITFAGLDPDLYPYWDEIFKKQARKTAVLSAERLSAALSHAKSFIFTDEQKAPQMCSTEIRNGLLFSTDLMAVSVVKMGGLEEAGFRIFGSDVKALLSFLSTFKPTKAEKAEDEAAKKEAKVEEKSEATPPEMEVEVWESDKAVFLRRNDGAIFGESKFDKRFPDLTVDWATSDDFKVTLAKEEVESAVKFLTAGAKWEDTVMRIEIQKGNVIFYMASVNGKMNSLEVPVIDQWEAKEKTALPEGGFPVSNAYVLSLLGACVGKTVTFGVARRAKGGWIRVQDERGPDTFLTTVGWLKIG